MLKKYKEALIRKGYKLTPQRRAVFEIISNSEGKHYTAEEIYNVVKETNPGIGIATVYRTLQVLEEIGFIKKDYLGSGIVRYEKNDEEGHSHHHLVCIGCGDILEEKEDLMDKIEDIIEKNYGFKIIDHNIKFIGYCSKCNLKKKEVDSTS